MPCSSLRYKFCPPGPTEAGWFHLALPWLTPMGISSLLAWYNSQQEQDSKGLRYCSSIGQTKSILLQAGVTAACSPLLLLVRALEHRNIQLRFPWAWDGCRDADSPGLKACSGQWDMAHQLGTAVLPPAPPLNQITICYCQSNWTTSRTALLLWLKQDKPCMIQQVCHLTLTAIFLLFCSESCPHSSQNWCCLRLAKRAMEE